MLLQENNQQVNVVIWPGVILEALGLYSTYVIPVWQKVNNARRCSLLMLLRKLHRVIIFCPGAKLTINKHLTLKTPSISVQLLSSHREIHQLHVGCVQILFTLKL